MLLINSKLISFILLTFGLALCAKGAEQVVQVVTKLGTINGQVVESPYEKQPVNQFLGIPYAKPPIENLRFLRPVPITEKWTEPLEATSFPAQCVQDKNLALAPFNEPLVLSRNFSEDCLYLNIWSPDVAVVSEEKLKPVLIWIHGGALTIGTSSFDLYNGEVLAAAADAVVVTINYRVSTLGFLYSSEVAEVGGNQGLFDQAAALEWVQEHIRYFGGDPQRVTLMGQSAGGWSVSLHVLSPVTRNWFQSAIMMSGAVLDDFYTDGQQFEQLYLTGIRKVNCATDKDTTITKEVVRCLQALPAEDVDKIYNLVDRKSPLDILPLVVIDGEFLPASPRDLLAKGNYKTNVNLLSSVVEDEASFILALVSGQAQFKPVDPQPITLPEAQGVLAFITSGRQSISQAALNKLYFSGLNADLDISNDLRKRVGIAYEVFRNSPTTATVYQWYYTAKLGNLKFLCNQWAGACHCDELYPAFGMAFRYPDKSTSREKEISTEIMTFIKSFLYHGKPTAEQPEWEPFFLSGENQKVIAPYYEINNGFKKPENFKFNLKELECAVLNH
ncbi:hypothetical protein TYRP_010049 [Tyrophagus putrescentiae]|nr:hypothetical protein TYRP_010049 [Tyrophagus putrescentiae]